MRTQVAFQHIEDEILRYVSRGVHTREALFYIFQRPEPREIEKIAGRHSLYRADFRIVAKYLRTIYSVM